MFTLSIPGTLLRSAPDCCPQTLLTARLSGRCRLLTPASPSQRGCQLSLEFSQDLAAVHARLEARGVVCDVRLPRAMRVAPAPLYNTFTEVWQFVNLLEEALGSQ